MLVVIFTLGKDRFAVNAADVREIAPLAEFKPAHKAPEFVAGLADFRGEIIPAIDLRRLIMDQPCRRAMSTRIILMEYRPAPDAKRTLGLLAERVTDTVSVAEADLSPSGLVLPEARFLGDVFKTPDGMVQLVEPGDILTAEARRVLYSEADHGA